MGDLTAGVKSFQKMSGLTETGSLDDDHGNDIEIVFCDFTECLVGFSAENDNEELARPVEKDGKMTLYLDSAHSWADDSTLSQLSYGGVMHLQIQLIQVVLHQFGHAMGLEHSGRMSSAMVPFYMEWVNGLQPDKEDFTMIVMTGKSRVKAACWQLFALSL